MKVQITFEDEGCFLKLTGKSKGDIGLINKVDKLFIKNRGRLVIVHQCTISTQKGKGPIQENLIRIRLKKGKQ